MHHALCAFDDTVYAGLMSNPPQGPGQCDRNRTAVSPIRQRLVQYASREKRVKPFLEIHLKEPFFLKTHDVLNFPKHAQQLKLRVFAPIIIGDIFPGIMRPHVCPRHFIPIQGARSELMFPQTHKMNGNIMISIRPRRSRRNYRFPGFLKLSRAVTLFKGPL